MQVISLRNGKKGDSIEVQSLDTKKKFQAIVIDSRTVKLIL
jgi:flagella basal body P-ring formation protein FlgA